MPIYEYRCRQCETRFEKLLLRTTEDVACPSCEGSSVEKLLSAFAVVTGTHRRPLPATCAAGPCGRDACAGGTGCGLAE